MANADDTRGHKLAELARQFLLWLQDNELPQIAGLRGAPLNLFELYAGVYRKAEWIRGGPFDVKLPPGLALGAEAEQRRFAGLRLGGTHVLLLTHPEANTKAPDGTLVRRNRIVAAGKAALTQPGALVTVAPLLDSLKADEATIHSLLCFDFTSIQHRADLVWDDAAEGARSGIKYPFIFAYETPRRAYLDDLQDVLVPSEIEPKPGSNRYAETLAKRTREFREHLYHNATYSNRRRVAEDGGGYYAKWSVDEPFNQRERQFGVTMLSDDYLKECFFEFVMKENDDLLMVELGRARYLYRLLWEPPSPKAAAPTRFSVQHMVTIGEPPKPTPKYKDEEGDEMGGTLAITYPVRAAIFHALEGGNELPQLKFGKLDPPSSLPQRFVVDYKAFVRWYYDKAWLALGSDEKWFDSFVDTLFGDASYMIELQGLHVDVDRDALFLNALSTEAAQGEGPIQERMQAMVAWCKEKPDRFFSPRA